MSTEPMQIEHIDVSLIDHDYETNCRGEISVTEVAGLAKDIEASGLLQPLVVRKLENGRYQLVAGFRRYTAMAVVLERKTVPCVIKDCTIEDARFFNLAENLQRKNLNILQEAKAVKKLLEYGYSQEEIGRRLGMSRGWAQVRCQLLSLPDEIQVEAQNGILSHWQIAELCKLATKEDQFEAVKKLKDAHARGQKLSKKDFQTKRNVQPNAKRTRTTGEINEMNEFLMEQIGTGMHSRALAWAAGEISTADFELSIREANPEAKEFELWVNQRL